MLIESEHRGEEQIALCGVNHRGAEVSLREKFSLGGEESQAIIQDVLEKGIASEAVVLSTCNRFEIVTAKNSFENPSKLFLTLEETLAKRSGVSKAVLKDTFYHFTGRQAVTHVFRVASGLDSMVIGEAQILGQLKAAYHEAHLRGTTCSVLNRLFHRAFGVAKEVRSKTKIGQSAVSVCYAARELAKQIFGELSDARVMLIGTGETGELALKHFRAAGVSEFFLVNKTLERALALAQQFDGVPLALENFEKFLPQADIIIGASALPVGAQPLISVEDARASEQNSRGRTRFFIDLGVPRNFEQGISELRDSFLYDIDDLGRIVKQNLNARELEVDEAEVIIHEEVEKFSHWLCQQEFEPTIREVQSQFRDFKREEIEKSLRRLRREGFSPNECVKIEYVLRDLADALVSKTLHKPLTVLKRQAPRDKAVHQSFRDLLIDDELKESNGS